MSADSAVPAFRRAAVLSLAALLAAPLAALHAQGAPERRTLKGDRVAIFDLVGSIRVEAGTGSDVEVEVTRQGADAGRLTIETGERRGRETLRVVFPGDRFAFPKMGRGSSTSTRVDDDGTFYDNSRSGRQVRIAGTGGLEAWADVVVRVPKGRDVQLFLAAGEASATNVTADLAFDVGAADVTTRGTRGTLSLDTGSGSTSVTDAEGDLTMDTGSGEVTIEGVRGTRLSVDAGSGGLTGRDVRVTSLKLDLGSGGTRIANLAADDLWIDSGSGEVDLGLVTDVSSLVLDSGSGGVTLRLPATLGATLEVDTGSGGIDTDVPITLTRRSRSALYGTIGDGKGRIRIDSGSGEVRLLKN